MSSPDSRDQTLKRGLQVVAIILILMNLGLRAQASNGEGRGGGNVFVSSSYFGVPGVHAALLDLVTSPSYRATEDLPQLEGITDFSRDVLYSFAGYRYVEISRLAAFEVARQRVLAWRPYAPLFGDWLERALAASTAFVFTDEDLELSPQAARYFLSPTLRGKGSVIPAVRYSEDHYPLVNTKLWRQLGRLSQAGLIVHEALRHIQLSYAYADLTDENLQRLTAEILLSDPATTPSLDEGRYLNGQFRKTLKSEASFVRARAEQTREICEMIAEISPNNPHPAFWNLLSDWDHHFCAPAQGGYVPSLEEITGFWNSLAAQFKQWNDQLSGKTRQDLEAHPELKALVEQWNPITQSAAARLLRLARHKSLRRQLKALDERSSDLAIVTLNMKDSVRTLRFLRTNEMQDALISYRGLDTRVRSSWPENIRQERDEAIRLLLNKLRILMGLPELDGAAFASRLKRAGPLYMSQVPENAGEKPVFPTSEIERRRREGLASACRRLSILFTPEPEAATRFPEAARLKPLFEAHCRQGSSELALADSFLRKLFYETAALQIDNFVWYDREVLIPLGPSFTNLSLTEFGALCDKRAAEWKNRPIGSDATQAAISGAVSALLRYLVILWPQDH